MGNKGFQRSVAKVVAAMAIGLLAGCATVGTKPKESAVAERAQARWNALVQGDVKSAYEYFSPGSRQTMTLAEFASGIRIGFWKAVKVDKVECASEERCDVHVTITYDHRGTRINTPHRETWVWDGRQWWFLRR